jgi:glycosyltransferase involved in cell wall biosynthesis
MIRQQNAGPAAARNRGLERCRSEFVVFVDADDELMPNNLACKFAMFSAPDLVAAFAGFTAISPDGRRFASTWRDYLGPLEPGLIGRRGGLPGGLPLYMFRTAALKEISGLDEDLRIMEDFDAIIRLGRAGGCFVGSNEPIYIRHIRPFSVSRGSSLRLFADTLKFLSKARRENYFGRMELLRRCLQAIVRVIPRRR